MTATEQRQAVLEQARKWFGTPYAHRGMVRGAGVDCAMLLAAVYRDAGVVPEVEVPDYPLDWHMHRDEEKYMQTLLRHCAEIDAPAPGDIALFRFGRVFSHGSIVAAWPAVIHSYVGIGCELVTDVTRDGRLNRRPVRFFTPWRDE